MPSIWVPEANAALTADGSATGYITVADNSPFYPSAEAFLYSANVTGQRVKITELVSTNKIGIRFLGEFPNQVPTYGKSDCSSLKLADTAMISMPGQVVRVEQPTLFKTLSV